MSERWRGLGLEIGVDTAMDMKMDMKMNMHYGNGNEEVTIEAGIGVVSSNGTHIWSIWVGYRVVWSLFFALFSFPLLPLLLVYRLALPNHSERRLVLFFLGIAMSVVCCLLSVILPP